MKSSIERESPPCRAFRFFSILVLAATLSAQSPTTPEAAPEQTQDSVQITLDGTAGLRGELMLYLTRPGENRARLWQRIRFPGTRSVVFEGLAEAGCSVDGDLVVGVAMRGEGRIAIRFRATDEVRPRLDLSRLASIRLRIRGTTALGTLDHLGIRHHGARSEARNPARPSPDPTRLDIFQDWLFPTADGREFRGYGHPNSDKRNLQVWITGVADQNLPVAWAQFDELALDPGLPPVELAALRGARARLLDQDQRIVELRCESLTDRKTRFRLLETGDPGIFAARSTIAELVHAGELQDPTRIVVVSRRSDLGWSWICPQASYDAQNAQLDFSLGAESVRGMDCGFALPDTSDQAIHAHFVHRDEDDGVARRAVFALVEQRRHVEVPPLRGRAGLAFANEDRSLVSPVYPVIADANYKVRLRPAHQITFEFKGIQELRHLEPFLIVEGSATRSAAHLLESLRQRYPMRPRETVLLESAELALILGIARHGLLDVRALLPGHIRVRLGWRGAGDLIDLDLPTFSTTNARFMIDVDDLLDRHARLKIVNATRGFLDKDEAPAAEWPTAWRRRLTSAQIPPGTTLPVLSGKRSLYTLDESGSLRTHQTDEGNEKARFEIGEEQPGVALVLSSCPADLQAIERGPGRFSLHFRPTLARPRTDGTTLFEDWPGRVIELDEAENRFLLPQDVHFDVTLVFEPYLRGRKSGGLARFEGLTAVHIRKLIAGGWPWTDLR